MNEAREWRGLGVRSVLGVVLLGLSGAWGCGGGGTAAPVDLAAYQAGRMQFPGASWPAASPERLGWSAEGLARVREIYDGTEAAALMAVHRGVPVVEWGNLDARYNAQSMRKSLLSPLIGLEVEAGRMDLSATLRDLGIEDDPPLSDDEKEARVGELMHTSSDVFHSAIYEAGSWKRNKPERGSHPAGSFWFYNNWDFNLLGTLFERSAGLSIGRAFEERIARPIGMQEFRAKDVPYLTRGSLTEKIQHNASNYPAYVFMISARDLARFGLLYLNEGRWAGRQVLPEAWVRRTAEDAVEIGEYEEWFGEGCRYGLLWWVMRGEQYGAPAGTTALVAQGSRGHQLVVIPALDLVVVHRVATGGIGLAAQLKRRFFGSGEVSDRDVERMVAAVIAAMPH